MALKREVGFFTGLRYHGQSTMLAWMLHRITGVAILAFTSLHIVANFFLLQAESGLASAWNALYTSPVFQVLILFCILFHAINGLRIATQDLWPALMKRQHTAILVEWLIFTPIFILAVILLIQSQ